MRFQGCSVSVSDESKKRGVGALQRCDLSIGKCHTTSSVKQKAVPAIAQTAANKAIPPCFNHAQGMEQGVGGHKLLFRRQENFVLLEGRKMLGSLTVVPDKTSLRADYKVAELKIKPCLHSANYIAFSVLETWCVK